MDYRKSAAGVLEQIGGKDNIVSAAHCATRLRLVIADNNKCNKQALEEVEGVKGVFEASGQLQIIFGEPMYFQGKHNDKVALEEFSQKIMKNIENLINLHSQ